MVLATCWPADSTSYCLRPPEIDGIATAASTPTNPTTIRISISVYPWAPKPRRRGPPSAKIRRRRRLRLIHRPSRTRCIPDIRRVKSKVSDDRVAFCHTRLTNLIGETTAQASAVFAARLEELVAKFCRQRWPTVSLSRYRSIGHEGPERA